MQWWVSMSTNGHRYPHLKGKRAHKKCQSSWREKMDFSWQILDKKASLFAEYALYWLKSNNTHTWGVGEGFRGAVIVLEGGIMVMKNAHVESYAFQLSTDLAKVAKVHFGQISTKLKWVENRVHETFGESLLWAAFGKYEWVDQGRGHESQSAAARVRASEELRALKKLCTRV
jgi:hypothetical protein